MRRAIVLTTLLGAGVAAMVAQPAPESSMASAAKALVSMLDDGQVKKIRWPFDSEERFNWHFIPRDRQGLSFRDMTEPQRQAAMALLRAGLGEKGTRRPKRSGASRTCCAPSRDARSAIPSCTSSIFGEPGSAAWGWRYEGHHISQNWTIVGGKAIATTPAFFGANPANVQDGPEGNARAAAEEDLARSLVTSLTEEQRKTAITSEKAPNDILTFNSRKAAILETSASRAAT